MSYLISKNEIGELIGFASIDDAQEISKPPTPCQVFVADVIPSATLNADAREVYWLYEVCFSGGESVFVTAFDYSDALVTAVLSKGCSTAPISVNEYDLYELEKLGNGSLITYTLDERITPVLDRLSVENRDLIARVLPYVLEYSEDELRESESDYILRALGVAGKIGLDLSADEVRKVCSYIWNNYLLFEATGALMNVRRLHGRFGDTSDTRLALLWTYIFEQWAHYDCHLPYTLYRLLIEGGFDDLLVTLSENRNILE